MRGAKPHSFLLVRRRRRPPAAVCPVRLRHRPRRRSAVLCAAVAFLAMLVGPVPPAYAHAFLLRTSPPADGLVARSPASIELTFSEAVTLPAGAVTASDASGRPVAVGTPRSSADGRTVTVPVGGQVTGAVEVRWRVIGDDGDLVDGAFGFAVGSAAPMPRRGAGRSPIAPALRWLLLVGLAGALGTAVLSLVLPAAAGAQPQALLRRLSAASGVLIVAAVAASSYPLLTASALTTSRAGRFALVEFVAAAFGVLLTLATQRLALPAATFAVVAAAEGARGHPGVSGVPWGAAAGAVHVIAVSTWLGSLVGLLVVASRTPQRSAPLPLVRAYAKLALPVAAVAVASGAVSRWAVLGRPADLARTGYGRLLVVKLTVVALALLAALVARAALSRPNGPRGLRAVFLGTRLEAAALLTVVVVTAFLVTLGSTPRASHAAVAPPLAVQEPVLHLGVLAGNVTGGLAARPNGLQLSLSTPLAAEAGGGNVAVDAKLTDPTGTVHQLRLRSCGRGCQVDSFTWREGRNTVTLRVRARHWAGGTVTLPISWPPGRDAAADLTAAIARLRGEHVVQMREQVTSGPGSRPSDNTARKTGAEFAAEEPYAAPGAAARLLTSSADGTDIVTYIEGFPLWITVHLDQTGRLLREEIISPNHSIARSFSYLQG